MMANSLQSLFRAIAQARDEDELRSHVMVRVSEYFAAQRWALFFFDQLPPINTNIQGILKLAVSVEHNPVLRYLVEHHAPVHEELLLPPGMLQIPPFFYAEDAEVYAKERRGFLCKTSHELHTNIR